MQCFGLFELGSVLASGGGTTTFEARKQTDPAGKYVVKVFSPEGLVPEEQADAKSELDPLLQELGAEFAGRIIVQKEAAETSPWFVPILGAGSEDRGTWYATRCYPRSVQGLIRSGVALGAHDIFHILQALVQAALHLKRTSGRSHGNLKPANIFIDGLRKVRNSRVLVADALAGTCEDAQRFERADLRSLGELLYQLVRQGRVDFAQVTLPIEPGMEWSRVFGNQAERWLGLCNRMLVPGVSAADGSLELIERELPMLQPAPTLPTVPLAIVSVVLLLAGLTAFAVLHHRRASTVTVPTDSNGSSAPDQAAVPTQTLATQSDYGTVIIDLQPADIRDHATIQRGDTKSPMTVEGFSQRAGDTVPYRVEAPGYEPYTTNLIVAPKETRHIRIMLARQPVPVKVPSTPPGIPLYTSDNVPLKRAGDFYLLPWGRAEIIARHPRLGSLTNSVMLSLDRPNTAPPFQFSFGILILTNLPGDISVTEGDNPVGTPADTLVYEPLGRHTYLLRAKSSFETIVTNILPGENYLLPASASK